MISRGRSEVVMKFTQIRDILYNYKLSKYGYVINRWSNINL